MTGRPATDTPAAREIAARLLWRARTSPLGPKHGREALEQATAVAHLRLVDVVLRAEDELYTSPSAPPPKAYALAARLLNERHSRALAVAVAALRTHGAAS